MKSTIYMYMYNVHVQCMHVYRLYRCTCTCEDRCAISTGSGSWMVTDFTPANITFFATEMNHKFKDRYIGGTCDLLIKGRLK